MPGRTVNGPAKGRSAGGDVNARTGDGMTVLMYAALWGDLDCAESLVFNKPNLPAKSVAGETALMAAAAGDHVDCMRFLVSRGVTSTQEPLAAGLRLITQQAATATRKASNTLCPTVRT